MPAVSCERAEESSKQAAKQAPPETAVRAEGNIGSNLQISERRTVISGRAGQQTPRGWQSESPCFKVSGWVK